MIRGMEWHGMAWSGLVLCLVWGVWGMGWRVMLFEPLGAGGVEWE